MMIPDGVESEMSYTTSFLPLSSSRQQTGVGGHRTNPLFDDGVSVVSRRSSVYPPSNWGGGGTLPFKEHDEEERDDNTSILPGVW